MLLLHVITMARYLFRQHHQQKQDILLMVGKSVDCQKDIRDYNILKVQEPN